MKIRAFGYRAINDPEAVLSCLAADGAVLVDIRAMPFTGGEWGFHTLRERLGSRYRWVKQLGNARYKEAGEIELIDAAAGVDAVKKLADEFPTVVLMCACEDATRCHRSVVAKLLRDEGLPVTDNYPSLLLFDLLGESSS